MKLLAQSPETRCEAIREELMVEREIWLPLRARVARTAGLDGQLNLEYKLSNDCMNELLDKYFAANVMLELGCETA